MNGCPWIKNTLFDKMFDLTSNEISFLLYISRYQNEKGKVLGVYYKDVCENIYISIQTFYTVLYSLRDKGIIIYKKNHYMDYDITILDNDFSDANKRRNYFVVTNKLFSLPEFHTLKAGEKLLAIYIYRFYETNHTSYKIRCGKFIDKWTKLLKVSSRVIKGYLHKLKHAMLISEGVKDDKYYMTPLQHTLDKINDCADRKYCHKEIVVALCRRKRIKRYHQKDVDDVAVLFDQYSSRAAQLGKEIVDCMSWSFDRVVHYYRSHEKERALEPKLIHSLLKVAITE